jgi:lipopolysaccharide assembly protein A
MPDDPTKAPHRRAAPLPGEKPKPDRSWRFYAAIAIAVVALIFILQNSQDVEVDFIFATANTPLFFILVITFALGFLAGWLLPHVRRGRKRDE